MEAPREGQQEDQCWELRQRVQQEKANSTEEKRGAVGHDLPPPNCFSKDLFLSSTPHPQDLAVILAGSVGLTAHKCSHRVAATLLYGGKYISWLE